MTKWTFLTNHGAVLAIMAQASDVTAREMAFQLGITERSVHRIISELESGGYVIRERAGRGNRYTINHHLPLRRAHQRDIAVGELLNVLVSGAAQRGLPPLRTWASVKEAKGDIP